MSDKDRPISLSLGKDQQKAFNAITGNLNTNFFIQGQAGTGKSLLINTITKHFDKIGHKYAVVAPTGLAAQLIGGSTIHSLFCLGGKPFFPKNVVESYKNYKEEVSEIETLIIDEVSMLRADVLDTINTLCQKAKDNEKVFGGIQLVLVGDLNQLPPVYKYNSGQEFTKNEQGQKDYMLRTYKELKPFFFDAECYEKAKFNAAYKLRENFRQKSDKDFLDKLNIICENDENRIDEALAYFNKSVINLKDNEANIPVVTCTKAQAARINNEKLKELNGEEMLYMGTFSGEFYDPNKCAPKDLKKRKENVIAPEELKLKLGAQVMICASIDPDCVNGTIGLVTKLDTDKICVKIKTDTQIEKDVEIIPITWKEQKYIKTDKGKLDLKTIGEYKQFPLKLAYAITIHKSQGQTWQNVLIDLGHGAFESGQVYVALSRVKSGKGVCLTRPLDRADIMVNKRVQQFLNGKIPEHTPYEVTFEGQVQELQYLVKHVSKISPYRNSSSWTIWNNELDTDLYLQAGKAGVDKIIYIFKIKAGTYTIDNFEQNDERIYGKKWAKPDPRKRDIIIDLTTFQETRKKDSVINFKQHLWKIIDYKTETIKDNPDYQEDEE